MNYITIYPLLMAKLLEVRTETVWWSMALPKDTNKSQSFTVVA